MSRIAIVASAAGLRRALVAVAGAGCVEIAGPLPPPAGEAVEALRRLERRTGSLDARLSRLSPEAPDPGALEERGAADLLAGEIELGQRAAAAVRHGRFAALVGWTEHTLIPKLAARLAPAGAAVVELPAPRGEDPPTLLRPVRPARPFRILVETYGPARYTDIDPTPFAAAAFVLMFGMMFADVGQGLLLAALALLLSRTRRPALARWRHLWPLPAAAGLAGAAAGLLYGEAFGPTGLPALWLRPVDHPERLLVGGAIVGGVLLAVSYGIGIVNRWRGGGAVEAALAPSGGAGLLVFLGVVAVAVTAVRSSTPLLIAGLAAAACGALLMAVGYARRAGRGAAAGAQAAIELVDSLIRVAANLVSFTRLAAFGLMHAAIAAVVLDAARALWGAPAGTALAVVVFAVGTALAFSLEVLVVGVQAMRLEYYELFSRVFGGEGRPFAPWSIPLAPTPEAP